MTAPGIVFPFDTEAFFEKCVKHDHIPKNDFEKQVLLLRLLEEFEDDTRYAEPDVNEKIKKYFSDYVMMRRELINFGYMQRDPSKGEYWVVKRTLTMEAIKNNTLLARHAKDFLEVE